jgi:hypothetical protein
VVRLYGLRMGVEQSYKHTTHALGWSPYQVRAARAIRRHWALGCCAFACWWYHQRHLADDDGDQPAMADAPAPAAAEEVGWGKSTADPRPTVTWPAALRAVRAWLEPWGRLWRSWRGWSRQPPPPQLQALLDWVRHGTGIDLYASL